MMANVSRTPESRRAKVSRILTFSCVDGPGNRLVIFFQGCNYDCTSCHNPHSISHCNHCGICVLECPDNALSFNDRSQVVWHADKCSQCDRCIEVCGSRSSPKIRHYSADELLKIVCDNQLFISGITVSGGEASLQLPVIKELFSAIKSHPDLGHLTCFIDSNGSLSEAGWTKVAPYLDGAMIDLKAWDGLTHEKLTGRNNKAVFRSLSLLNSMSKLYEVRLLVIPGQTDYLKNIDELSAYIKELNPEVIIRLNAFQHHGVEGEALLWDTCTRETIEELKLALEERIPNPVSLPSLLL